MQNDSYKVLKALAEGREVLGLNGALFSSALRGAFGEGAEAIRTVAAVRAALGNGEAELPTEATVLPLEATPALASDEPAEVAASPQDIVAETPHEALPEAAASVAAAEAVEQPVAAGESVVSTEPADDRPEPMATQSDEPDVLGWRPSEDAMLLDEYVGLGLSVEEVAENHGRPVEDIVRRLRERHGMLVETPELPASAPAPSVAPALTPAALAPAPAPVPEPEPTPVPAESPAAVSAQPKAEGPASEPSLEDYEAVIAIEMKRAGPDAVHFATGVLKHMERAPSAVAQLQAYLQSAKARSKLQDRLRLALLAKVVAKLKAA